MKKKVFSLLLAGLLTFSMGTAAYATEDEIADMQAQKQEAEAGLAQAQADISSLESRKQELENYLEDLNSQYDELTNSVSELSIQAGEKENQLKQIRADLEKAKKASRKQYEAMKLRIQYMYENGGATALEAMLSSQSLGEFINAADSISKLSQYDRKMLEKYENLQKQIHQQQETAQQEKESIEALLAERGSAQQEVQNMVASTSDDISSYVYQISASQEEADALMAQISTADNNIAVLMQQAEEEKAAREAAQAAQAQQDAVYDQETDSNEDTQYSDTENGDTQEADTEQTDTYSEDAGDTYSEEQDYDTESDSASQDYEQTQDEYAEDSQSEDSQSDSSEDVDTEDSYEETDSSYAESDSEDVYYEEDDQETDSSTESASSSGQGTYLGNFTLTAYCNCALCCGTAGNLTASGTVPTAGRTVAMAGVPFGTQLLINGNVYTVEDLGTPYGHVDIYCNSHSEALSFGLQSAEVYRLN